MNKAIRAAVFARARWECECGCGKSINEHYDNLDHVFGRAKAEETMETCWALSLDCDYAKTNNRPDAATWLHKFIVHASKHLVRTTDRAEEGRWIDVIDRAVQKRLALRAKGLAS